MTVGLGEPHSGEGRGLSRRRAVQALAAGAAMLGTGAWRWAATPAAGAVRPVPLPDEALGVLRAYVATLVPGPEDDPAGTPGGVEAGGVEAIVAHAPYVVPLLTADLTAAALVAHGRPFPDLTYAEREALVAAGFADDARVTYNLIALALGAGAFYADFYGPERGWLGARHLGYPGPSDGYLATYADGTGHGQPQRDAVPG